MTVGINSGGPLCCKNIGKHMSTFDVFGETANIAKILNDNGINGMIQMENEKKFYKKKQPKWTKFTYILKTKRNKESSELGANNFKINIILTMLFNQKFKKVELKSKDINLIYEKEQEQQKE